MNLTDKQEEIYETEVLNGAPAVIHGDSSTHFLLTPTELHPDTTLVIHESTESFYVWAEEYVNGGDADDAWIALDERENA